MIGCLLVVIAVMPPAAAPGAIAGPPVGIPAGTNAIIERTGVNPGAANAASQWRATAPPGACPLMNLEVGGQTDLWVIIIHFVPAALALVPVGGLAPAPGGAPAGTQQRKGMVDAAHDLVLACFGVAAGRPDNDQPSNVYGGMITLFDPAHPDPRGVHAVLQRMELRPPGAVPAAPPGALVVAMVVETKGRTFRGVRASVVRFGGAPPATPIFTVRPSSLHDRGYNFTLEI